MINLFRKEIFEQNENQDIGMNIFLYKQKNISKVNVLVSLPIEVYNLIV